jgi:hypothetical protein
MHAVCSLEYAYVLSQFVRCVTRPDLTYALETEEQALISTIKETLREVEASMPQGKPGIVYEAPELLGSKAVRAWAMIIEGMRTWNAVDFIAKTLCAYAELLEAEVVRATIGAST